MKYPFYYFSLIFILFSNYSFSQWTLLNSETNTSLRSVDFVNGNVGWVAGSSDIIKQTKDGGQNWSLYNGQLFPISRHWYSIDFVNEDEGYTCGRYYLDWYEAWWTYTKNGGDSWIRPPGGSFVPNTSNWTHVFFLNDKLGWRVGYRNSIGKISKTSDGVGGDWTTSNVESGSLYGVIFVDKDHGWMVGANGSIYKSEDGGENWLAQNSGTNKSLRSVYFTDALTGWAVGYSDSGSQAIILKTRNGGENWTSTLPENITELHSVYFSDELTGWACGSIYSTSEYKGVILNTENGGDTWDVQYIEPTCIRLYDIDFANGVGYVVGSKGVILKSVFGDEYLNFTSVTDMDDKRFGFSYTGDGKNAYIVGGQKPNPFGARLIAKTIEKYNPVFESWTQIASGLIPRRFSSAEFIESQNKIYIFNGDTYSNDSYTDTVEVYDLGLNQLSYITDNPYPVEYGGSAVWNDKIYLFGGSNTDGYSRRMYVFDTNSLEWTRLADMPEPKQTNGEIIDGVLYVFGGYNHFTSKKIHAYDIENESWSYLGDLPFGVSAHATTSSAKNIWLIGSYDNISFIGVYDSKTNEFIQKYSNMIGRRHAGTAVIGPNLFVFGGNQSSSYETILNSTQSADIADFTDAISDPDHAIQSPVKVFPNPFSDQVNIEYKLQKAEQLTIKICDISGEIVKVFKSKQLAGTHKFTWKSIDQPEGVYFYQIKIGNNLDHVGKLIKTK